MKHEPLSLADCLESPLRADARCYCAYCGQRFAAEPWPRTCRACSHVSYLNPLPVVVVLVPVDDGLLAIRRATPPAQDRLALPGGFIDYGETWQAAGAREVLEETGVVIAPDEIREYRVRSAADGTLLVFGLARKRAGASLPLFTPNPEASERVIVTEPLPMAFSQHTDIVKDFFFW